MSMNQLEYMKKLLEKADELFLVMRSETNWDDDTQIVSDIIETLNPFAEVVAKIRQWIEIEEAVLNIPGESYSTRPKTIKAVQINGTMQIPGWFKKAIYDKQLKFVCDNSFPAEAICGTIKKKIALNDWVILLEDGQLDVCSSEEFEYWYTKVEQKD